MSEELPSREDADALALVLENAGMFDDAMHDASLIVRRFAQGRLVNREAMIEGIVTSVGNNTILGHGEPGPWAFVTIYGDFEMFDTMLVAAFGGTDDDDL